MSKTRFPSPHSEARYRQQKALLDELLKVVGADESHPLAGLLETVEGWGVVLDDLQARKCANVLDVPLMGALGLVR